MHPDDAALVEQTRAGSTEAASALYRRYWPLVWQWAYALTGSRERADDLAQDALLRGFRSLASFDAQRPLVPWLKRILLNLARDEFRRLRRGELPADWMVERRAIGAEERASDEVVAAVRQLAPARRLVVVLHYWLDMAVDDIAVMLDLPYGTVASRLSRALADLRMILAEDRVR